QQGQPDQEGDRLGEEAAGIPGPEVLGRELQQGDAGHDEDAQEATPLRIGRLERAVHGTDCTPPGWSAGKGGGSGSSGGRGESPASSLAVAFVLPGVRHVGWAVDNAARTV